MKKIRLTLFVLLAVTSFLGCKKDEDSSPYHETGDYILGGVQYSGRCASQTSTHCSGGSDVTIVGSSDAKNGLIVYNMPTASSGDFTITNGWESLDGCNLYVVVLKNGKAYASKAGGTLTKTGKKSFSLNAKVNDAPDATTSIPVTALGGY